jgi:type IV pilus biogenesis protein CpaD/CtpE
MKKCKIVVLAVIAVLAAAALAGCGDKENEETGSNPDSDNGVIEEIVTDAATGVEEIVTDAATGAKEAITDAATGIGDIINDAVDNMNEEMTDPADPLRQPETDVEPRGVDIYRHTDDEFSTNNSIHYTLNPDEEDLENADR